ncbi:response regulator [Desulfonauticus submarinus]|uniref:Response regulator receiver domain-containing protein n=1 Tax=Desulfonauticus submarinus TaxID=206665 RepID=A0A1H0FL01_9BACT|nr:response regulator [Desulfonauticus submarinus]SDN95458.1 Response regulator receiver domain-containing protein [Desulfonauticus submarinus]
MKILLVDDEEELVATLAERLSFRGIEADFATTGEEALSLAEKHTYDLAILDMKMPKLSGLELMDKLKQIQPNLKFGFLTGHGSEQDFHATCDKGSCFYLVKPVDFEDFLHKLNEIGATTHE